MITRDSTSSLTLLTACGGGGKDAPAAAAPSSDKGSEPVKPPPAPTAADFSSADEPYFVAESSEAPREGDVAPPIYRLNILDGRGPVTATKPLAATALANGTFESLTPFTGKWTVIQKFKRTLEDVTEQQLVEVTKDGGTTKELRPVKVGSQYKEQLLGNGTLVFIQKDGEANKLVEIDLSRNSALTPKPLSSITDACTVTGSHLIKRDGSEAAVFVTTAGADKKCGESGSDDAKDNLVRIVKTGTTTAEERAKQYTPLIDAKQVVSHIYQDGVLTGVLAQRGAGATTQLEVLSPTLSEVLNTTPIKIGAVSQYATSPDDAKLGVEWIAHEPLETGAGYLRLQQVDGRGDYVNAMYPFSWNATDKTASTSATPVLRLTGGVPSNKGVFDHRYVYFVDGDQVFYGPTADLKKPFTALTVLDELADKTDTTRVQISHQTRDYLVVRAEGLGLDAAFAAPKDPDLLSVKLFDNTNQPKEKQQTPIGLWQKVITTKDGETRTPYLITKQRSSYDDSPYNPNSYSIKRTSLANGQGNFGLEAPGFAEFLDGVNRINVLSPVWSPIAINGQRDLVSAIVCPRPLDSKKGDCSTPGDEIKTVDFDKKSFGLVLGKFLVENKVKGSSIQIGDVYDGINAFANLTIINNLSTSYNDPVFFNTRLAVPDPTKITTRLPFVVTPKPAP
jgi:hypothetical protein